MAYRVYVTDCLYYQAQGQMLTTRYADLISNKKQDQEKSSEEIVADIMSKAGLRFKA